MLARWRLGVLLLAVLVGAGCTRPSGPPPPTTSEVVPTGQQTGGTPSPSVSIDTYAPSGWVDLGTVDPTILVEIRYHGSHNFTGAPVTGYLEPRCLLPEQTAQALHRAQVAALAAGYTLKVYDCYRPARAGLAFLAWRDAPGEAMRAEFYPGLTKRQVFSQGFVAAGRSNHSSGAAVDVTLVRLPAAAQRPYEPGERLVACTAPAGQRFADNSVDMGTGYDCFDPRAHTLDPGVTGEARDNRLLLRGFMEQGGFVNYRNEWWHYDLADPPYPGRYFDFPVAAAALT